MAQHWKIWREIVEEAKGAGIAVIGLAILFGLSVGVAFFFHYV